MSTVPTALSEVTVDHTNCRINRVHNPTVLWIGCSDARVPESVMMRRDLYIVTCPQCQAPSTPRCQCTPPTPGCQGPFPCQCLFPREQVFVHRNIANQFHLTDNNSNSVLTYGVTGIAGNPINEVRIVGHTDCGGVTACHKAAHGTSTIPPDSVLWTWLGPLIELAKSNKNDTVDQLAEKNVQLQMKNVKAVLGRLDRANVKVTGYLYNVGDGTWKEVQTIK